MLLIHLLAVLTFAEAKPPCLIEWGWDQLNTRQLRERIERGERIPFDGVVMTAVGRVEGKDVELAWNAFRPQAFTHEQFASAVEDLRALGRLRANCFLRFNVTPGNIDFFDDARWATIAQNAKLGAWIAQQAGIKGWMFDVEDYDSNIFKFKAKPPGHSFTEYSAACRQRGRQLIRAINAEYPDITLLLTFGHALVYGERDKLADSQYGLLPAFLDGMLETASEATIFVDGGELAYSYKTREQFVALAKQIRDSRKLSAVPEIYDRRMKIGFGLWIDYDWRHKGWEPAAVEKNHFRPEELRHSLQLALSLSDGYVWLYSEKPNWWTGASLSDGYLQAVRQARAAASQPASKPEAMQKP